MLTTSVGYPSAVPGGAVVDMNAVVHGEDVEAEAPSEAARCDFVAIAAPTTLNFPPSGHARGRDSNRRSVDPRRLRRRHSGGRSTRQVSRPQGSPDASMSTIFDGASGSVPQGTGAAIRCPCRSVSGSRRVAGREPQIIRFASSAKAGAPALASRASRSTGVSGGLRACDACSRRASSTTRGARSS
jgi:hypothetical protein